MRAAIPRTTIPTVEELRALLERLRDEERATSDAERIEMIAALESLKGAAAATQARLTVAFDASQRSEQRPWASPPGSKALVREMPHTFQALAEGRISEWRATILVRETAVLSAEHRSRVDATLGNPTRRAG